MLAYTGIVAEPHAEPFKPVPQLAGADPRAPAPHADTVAIQGVTGGNALLFYTWPHVYAIGMPYETPSDAGTDPKHVICSSSRAFVVASKKRPDVDPTYGRDRHLLASAANDVLFLYDGGPCRDDVGKR